MWVKKQQLEPDMEQWIASKLEKEYTKAANFHTAYLNYTQYIKQNTRLDESQSEIKIARRNINNFGWADDTTLTAESEEELRASWGWNRVEEKISLNIQNTKVMGSSPITSWQTEGENLEAVTDFLFFVSKITADNDCSHEIKRWLLLERKAMTNLDSILKSRDSNFQKVCIVKAMFFPSNHL